MLETFKQDSNDCFRNHLTLFNEGLGCVGGSWNKPRKQTSNPREVTGSEGRYIQNCSTSSQSVVLCPYEEMIVWSIDVLPGDWPWLIRYPSISLVRHLWRTPWWRTRWKITPFGRLFLFVSKNMSRPAKSGWIEVRQTGLKELRILLIRPEHHLCCTVPTTTIWLLQGKNEW